MSGAVALAADQRLTAYDFGPEHPMAPRRLPLALSLMRHSGVLTDADLLEFGPADKADLRLVHDQDYLDALTLLSADPGADPAAAARFGFVGDNEPFWGMDEAAREIAGATVAAVDAVAEGRVAHAFSPMGGLHHARRRQASGFCLINDVAVAIARCTRRRPWRVLYVDLDVHHGDGVQAAFYDDPRVLTVSLHETGRHLWPGSGDPYELGEPPGVGRSINLPLEPYTDDQGFLDAFDAVVAPLAATFRPDLLVSQDGCDGHAADPLADLHLTTGCFRELARRLHAIAHQHCQGRWVATGGGGYEVDRVVPRAWTLLWAELAERPLPPRIPESWRQAESGRARATLPTAWEDPPLDPLPIAAQVRELNARTVRLVRRLAR